MDDEDPSHQDHGWMCSNTRSIDDPSCWRRFDVDAEPALSRLLLWIVVFRDSSTSLLDIITTKCHEVMVNYVVRVSVSAAQTV